LRFRERKIIVEPMLALLPKPVNTEMNVKYILNDDTILIETFSQTASSFNPSLKPAA